MTLAERFAAAEDRLPLSDLCPTDRDELGRLLARVDDFTDLPGRWQASLLRAEHDAPPKAGGSCCCGG